MLLGNSGAGKSVAGNSILGKEEFETRPDSLVAVTQQCEKRRALVSGWKVSMAQRRCSSVQSLLELKDEARLFGNRDILKVEIGGLGRGGT